MGIPMNADSIVRWLAAVGVPTEVVSVGAEADNTWCLLRDEQPAEDGTVGWEVFWREQGNRYDWARFANEQVACHYLFGRLTWAQVVRGVVGVLPTDRPAPKSEPEPKPGPKSEPEPKPEAKPEAKPGPKPEPKPEARPEPSAELQQREGGLVQDSVGGQG